MGFNKTSLVNLGLKEERGRRRVVVHRFPQSVTIIFTFYYVFGEDISVDLSDDKHTQWYTFGIGCVHRIYPPSPVSSTIKVITNFPCLKPNLSPSRKDHNPKYGHS